MEDAERRVKVDGHLVENIAAKMMGAALEAGAWKVEITQFSGYGSKGLKEPRMVESGFTVTVEEAGT
jgi:hypothetical protein